MELTLQEVRALAYANYTRGGDYVIEMLTDEEIRNRFCKADGKKSLYDYMASVCEMRRYIQETCMV